jgi:hypothetical protein
VSLLFAVADLRNELQAFRELADPLLFPGSSQVLHTAASDLLGISKSKNPVRWQIHQNNPIKTQPSVGSYMPDEQGALTVHAEISFVWGLEPVRPPGDQRPATQVRLNGLASTQIRLLNGFPGAGVASEELAVWRMEIGDDAAPGAMFHVQVLGRDSDKIFPKQLDVPRLPSMLNSPFACMEFVLGELFQEEWPRVAMKDSAHGRTWGSIQARRHAQHLKWIASTVAATSGSPWVMWKMSQPPEALFLPA